MLYEIQGHQRDNENFVMLGTVSAEQPWFALLIAIKNYREAFELFFHIKLVEVPENTTSLQKITIL